MLKTKEIMKRSDIRIGFVPIARPTFDLELAGQLTDQLFAVVQEAGYQLVGSQELIMDGAAMDERIDELASSEIDMVLMLQSSFADSSMVVQLAEAVPAPLLMWALPEERVGGRLRINSFCGINLAAHGLRRAGLDYDYVYAWPEDGAAHGKLENFAVAVGIKTRLAGARIGRLGENPAGFDTCLVNYEALKSRLGVEVVQYELEPFFEGVRRADPATVSAISETVKGKLAGFSEVDASATEGTIGAYVTLDELARDENLSGMAVRCWSEFFTDLGCSACGAMSMLSDKMMPCSCEADVNGTITQLILQWISDEPAFGSD